MPVECIEQLPAADLERYTALRPLGNVVEGDGIRCEGLGSARIAEGSAR